VYNQEELENFRCIFDMFDKQKSGFVNVEELKTIIQSLGRDPKEARELLAESQLEGQRKLTFDEFLKIMKLLENRIVIT
jgi:Ca2+-binding EF-hand superfamily protein